jgi:hypothetical protein
LIDSFLIILPHAIPDGAHHAAKTVDRQQYSSSALLFSPTLYFLNDIDGQKSRPVTSLQVTPALRTKLQMTTDIMVYEIIFREHDKLVRERTVRPDQVGLLVFKAILEQTRDALRTNRDDWRVLAEAAAMVRKHLP